MSSTNVSHESATPTTDNSIDIAISECEQNISRHKRAALAEATVAIVLVILIGSITYGLGRLEGQAHDEERTTRGDKLQVADEAASSNSQEIRAIQRQLDALQRSQAEKPKDKKIETEIASYVTLVERNTKRATQLDEERERAQKAYDDHFSKLLITEPMTYATIFLIVMVVGVFTAMYRLHLREIAKNEQYKLGFRRIRIAANNAALPGFQSEVRTALTKHAFDSDQEHGWFTKRDKVESPLPGHPTTDIATAILNRLLDGAEIVFHPKPKG